MQSAFNSESGTGRTAEEDREHRQAGWRGWALQRRIWRRGALCGSVRIATAKALRQERAAAAGQEGTAVGGENRTLWLLLVKHFVFLKKKCLDFLV